MTNQQHAFGKPAVQVRPKMYDNVLRPKLENIRIKGKGIIENDKYFEFQRNGCFEEAYFSDSFSPLFKSDGSVWGVINTMYDVTQKVLNVQRLKTLEEIRCRTSDAVSLASSCQIMKTVLRNNADIPYALIYLVENNDSKKKSFSSFKSHNAHLAATTFDGDYKNGKVYGKIKRHFPDYFPETPEIIDLSKVIDENYIKQVTSTDSLPICKSWPIHLVLREDKHVNVVLKDGSQAVLLPTKISSSDQKTLSAILICGVNSRRRFDKKYMEFLKLVVSQMNLCLTHGKSMEEQKRSELYANLYSQKDMFFQNICDALQISMTLMSSPLDEVINECPQNTQIMSHLKTIQDNTIQLLKIFSILLQFLNDTISINIPAITTKKKYQILLVNDNADIREDLSSEFDVHHVCSGNAIQKLENINKLPDLILIDIMKINVNEYKLLEILKSDGKTQLIPVILLSTKDVEISSIKGSDKIDDHLIKPFCIRELIARIHANIKLSRLRYKLLLQRRNDEADRLLLSISSKILSRVDLKEILSYIVREIHSLLPCKRISIISCEPSEDISHTIYEDSSNVTSITEPLQLLEIDDNSKSPTSINLQEFLNNNFRVDIFNDIYCDDICENMSMLSVEIRANNDCWGWIKAYRSPNSIWLNSEIELLQEISNQINLASIYAKLYEESLEQDVQIKDAEKANKDKGERLAHTSHELRNPLGAIVGILSSLESTGLDDGDQRDMINIMARASDIVMSIVNDILDAARLEAQKITLINRTFNLLKLLSDTIEHFGERAGNKQIELILSCDVDDLQRYVKSDPDRLGQVLTHLLSNSIKFTEKGEIVMNVTMQSKEVIDEDEESPTCGEIVKRDCLLIEISDTGIGIDPEFIEHIWESFSKGDTSITRRQDGTGLGLSICKKLVAINGGEIKVESHLGKGSKFWLTWNIELLQPLSKYPNISCLGTLFDEEISYLLPHSIRSKRILIIHPVENARNAIAKYLKSIEIVDAFDTLDKGIQKAKDHVELYKQFAYDIIFISLYENNQEEVIKAVSELRKIEKNCNNPLSSLILFIVFPGDKRGALTERVIKNIEGRNYNLSIMPGFNASRTIKSTSPLGSIFQSLL
ncbi:protein-histidine kinase [Gigaspora margarita]|nr:protein-histidine kinase [Gigaspora margarita]